MPFFPTTTVTYTLKEARGYPRATKDGPGYNAIIDKEVGKFRLAPLPRKFYAAAECNEEFNEAIRKTLQTGEQPSAESLKDCTYRGVFFGHTAGEPVVNLPAVSLLFFRKGMSADESELGAGQEVVGADKDPEFKPGAWQELVRRDYKHGITLTVSDGSDTADSSDLGHLHSSVLKSYNGSSPSYYKLSIPGVNPQLTIIESQRCKTWATTPGTSIGSMWSMAPEDDEASTTTFWLKRAEKDA